jgi:hypothetical protein
MPTKIPTPDKERLILAGTVSQVVEHLPSKHEALSSNTTTIKAKTKQKG